MTLLTFKDKYVVASTTVVSTTSGTLVDDTEASKTFDLTVAKVVLVIYQANNVYGATMPLTGMQNAISVDGVDVANSWNSGAYADYPVRNCVFWVGILVAGSHTVKGRFASNTDGSTATISNRVLLIYIFNGSEFQYLDDATTATIASSTLTDDPNAQVTFTPSSACKALILYNAANSPGSTEEYHGKKVAINVGGTDYGQAEKAPHSTDYADSVFTCHALSLSAVSTTVKGRFASTYAAVTVTINRRQLAVLLLDNSTLLNIIVSTTQVSTTSSSLVDDEQATINRTTTEIRELLVVAMGTKRQGTSSHYTGECYGIKINANDRANSRGCPYPASSLSNSAATAYAEQLVASSHTVQGRFSNNTGTYTAKIDARQVVALWFVPLLPPWRRLLLDGDAAVLSDTAPVDVDFLAASAGVGTTGSRYDHKHDVPKALVDDLAPVDGVAATIGIANKFVRADHKHALGPMGADIDFNYYEAENLSLERRADLTAPPTGAAAKKGRFGFYGYDKHLYIYVG